MNKYSFEMKIKFSDSMAQYPLKVIVDVEGVNLEDVFKIVFSGASFRVRLQSWLRAKKTRFDEAVKAGQIEVKWLDIIDRGKESADYGDILMRLSKTEFVIRLTKDLGISEDEAIVIYNRKHGIV